MAKDGTNRGGKRVGSGRKKKAVAEKMLEGVVETTTILPEPAEFEGFDMPPVSDYLKSDQKCGIDLQAERIYKNTYKYLKKFNCEKLVSKQLIEQYAMSVARYIQCQEAISEYGFLAKHPTTGNAISSPYVNMGLQYEKQANQCWYLIWQTVKENNTGGYDFSPQDNLMERLLLARKGK